MTQLGERTAERVEAFLDAFFGPGNDAWPNRNPAFRHKDRSERFVKNLQAGVDAPVVLPRWNEENGEYAVYVITRDAADAAKTAELIESFAGPTYVKCDEWRGLRPDRLDPDDPVESAILGFAGERVTFRLRTGRHQNYRQQLSDALGLMQTTLAARPPRLWRVVKPVGRLLAEFDAALAAGGEAASRDILDQLIAVGGITATNLAHLALKRLDRLGQSRSVLEFPGIHDVVRQDPPSPVKEAILNAVYTVALEDPLAVRDLSAAKERLIEHGRAVPGLMHGDPRTYGPQAMTVLLLAAVIRDDPATAQRVITAAEELGQMPQIPAVVLNEARRLTAESSSSAEEQEPGNVCVPATEIGSWPALFSALAQGSPAAKQALEDRTWSLWPSPAESDQALAQFLDGVGNAAAGELWRGVGSFLDAVGYDQPAAECAHAFIRNAVAFDRYSPGDLAVVQALMEIALRAAPAAGTYAEILEDVGAECSRWVGPERASAVLDFVDRLFLAACPDTAARSRLVSVLLHPLWVHRLRLGDADIAFARRLSQELGIGFDWATSTDTREEASFSTDAEIPQLTVLLYSLDEAVLVRCQEEVKKLAPAVKVTTAYDHVATPQLRNKARHADVVVLATRCAKHAATGFITEHAKAGAQLAYADGSGSASMLRATMHGLRQAADTL
ncbi:protein DpdD [Streptomyces polygonati]|uniref:Protein DpdD n=1 Tax=Streptomyces polygonati TaxID=1617087 RepID=A0ABV8HRK5_9ACTN